jgi:hypothetical protein
MSERTPVQHQYSVRATFFLGKKEWPNFRIRIIQTQLEFQRQVYQALRRLDPSASVLSARTVVYPETVVSRFLEDDGGEWQVYLDATFISSLRLTRDEWIGVLATAFLWAYRFEYVYRWDGQSRRGVPSDWFGRQGDPFRFVRAANENESNGVVAYVGGSMLDRGPVVGTPQPETQAPAPRPQAPAPQPAPIAPAPAQSTGSRRPVSAQQPAAPASFSPPGAPEEIPWGWYAAGGALLLGAAYLIATDE